MRNLAIIILTSWVVLCQAPQHSYTAVPLAPDEIVAAMEKGGLLNGRSEYRVLTAGAIGLQLQIEEAAAEGFKPVAMIANPSAQPRIPLIPVNANVVLIMEPAVS
jgi:hypothetical protein